MAICEILQLGNPELYRPSEEITRAEVAGLKLIIGNLHDTLIDFRERYGVGRAIAASQIGVRKRLIYVNIDGPLILINPQLEPFGSETIELWDDCLCFPDLLVRVKRHRSCLCKYLDLDWQSQRLECHDDLSELVQHEYDHLDGILAVRRAIDDRSFALRSQKHLLSRDQNS
jgi:peptide deformylase